MSIKKWSKSHFWYFLTFSLYKYINLLFFFFLILISRLSVIGIILDEGNIKRINRKS